MATIEELVVRIGADLSALEKSLGGAERRILRASSRLKSAGAGLSLAATVPLAGIGAAASKFAGGFEKSMARSIAIMGDAGQALRTELGEGARLVAKDTTFSAGQAADAYYYLASAGLSAASSLAALPSVAEFATAGQFDLARATDLATDAQSALGLTIRDNAQKNLQNLIRVEDALVKANTLANASVEQFSEALTNKAGSSLRQVGKDIEEGLAVLSAFADQGVKGAEAGTRFGIVLRDLQTKAIRNADEFERLGVTVFDSNGEMINMADILQSIERALDGLSDAEQKATLLTLGFSDKSVSALLSLIGLSSQIRRYEKELRKAGGTTQEVASKQLDNFLDQMTLIWHRTQDVAITVGDSLNPVLEDLAKEYLSPLLNDLEGLAHAFAELSPDVQKTIVSIGLISAAIGPALVALGLIVGAVGNLSGLGALFLSLVSSPIVAGIALVVGAVADLTVHWEEFKRATEKIWLGIRLGVQSALDSIIESAANVLDWAGWTGLSDVFTRWSEGAGVRVDAIKDKLDSLIPKARETASELDALINRLPGLDKAVQLRPGEPYGPPKPGSKVNRIPPVTGPEVPSFFEIQAAHAPEFIKQLGRTTQAWLESSRAGQLAGEVATRLVEINSEYDNSLQMVAAQEQVYGESLDSNIARSQIAEDAINQLLELGIDPMDERIRALSETLIDNRNEWELWANDTIDLTREVANSTYQVFHSLVSGIAQSVGRAIVYQEELGKSADKVLKQVAASLISTLFEIGVNWVTQALVTGTAAQTESAAVVSAKAAETYANVFAGWSTIPFVGAAIGAGAAAAASAALIAGALVAKGSGLAALLAEGGIVTGPTLAMIGEGNQPEVVFPLSDLNRFIDTGSGDSNSGINVHIYLDGDDVTDLLGVRVVDRLKQQGVR